MSNEIRLAQALDYEPMFMTACETLIFPWAEDPGRSDEEHAFSVLDTPEGQWTRRVSREHGVFGDLSGFGVQTEADHDKLQAVCAQIGQRERPKSGAISASSAQAVGEDGVLVIGHPHVPWLCGQISPERHDLSRPGLSTMPFERSMEAIYQGGVSSSLTSRCKRASTL